MTVRTARLYVTVLHPLRQFVSETPRTSDVIVRITAVILEVTKCVVVHDVSVVGPPKIAVYVRVYFRPWATYPVIDAPGLFTGITATSGGSLAT